MVIIMFHFLSEQNCLKDYSFIPLTNWHKLINVFLLIEQCSVVLYLGRVSNSISQSTEQTMFGFNIILILIMQEKDSVHGEIKYSLIPILMNNCYIIYQNLAQLKEIVIAGGEGRGSQVHRESVIYSIGWYVLSWVGYLLMERYNQGLELSSSKEMFQFSICETLFLVSMAMGFFYSWQTYNVDPSEVVKLEFG